MQKMTECHLKNENCGFRCTGYDGKEVWTKIHDLPKQIDCESCSDHADKLFKGLHDHVSAGLGKIPVYSQNYKEFVDEVNCTYKICKVQGRCK